MKIKIELPVTIEVSDVHELAYLQGYYRGLDDRLCVRELGFDAERGVYLGSVYVDMRRRRSG